MSAGIYITKSGFRCTEWDSTVREYVDRPIRFIYHELRTVCHIEPDVTLGDIIRLVANNPALVLLIGEFSWCNVAAFAKELEKSCVKPSDLKWIEISRGIKINDRYGDHGEYPGDIVDFIDVLGRDDSETRWALDFTPVNEIAHLLVRLAPTVILRNYRNIKDGVVEEISGETNYSLLEVLTEIFYEISFHGSPADRDEVSAEVLNMVKQIESGETRTVPLEEVFKDNKPKVN